MIRRTPIYPDRSEELAFRRSAEQAQRAYFPITDPVFEVYPVAEPHTISVICFLRRHAYLIPILLEARPYLDTIFGQARCHLEIERDPEGGPGELFAVIDMQGAPEEGVKLLRRFDDEWFSRVAKRTHHRLNFTVDVHDPRAV